MTKPKPKKTIVAKTTTTQAKKPVAKSVVKKPAIKVASKPSKKASKPVSKKEAIVKAPAIKTPVILNKAVVKPTTVKQISVDDIRDNIVKQMASNTVSTETSVNTNPVTSAPRSITEPKKSLSFSEVQQMMATQAKNSFVSPMANFRTVR